jgi:hypothetical protein
VSTSRFISATVVIAALAIAAWWSIAIAWADLKITGNQTATAVSTVPDNADYLSRLARAIPDDPVRAVGLLRRAAKLNPWDRENWTELGLFAERNRDYSSAESFLLRAAEIDHQYQPRWSLANFYFRQQSPKEFWIWAKSTIALAKSDPLPILNLCGRMSEDGLLTERAGIIDPAMQASYFDYLLNQNRPDLLQPATQRVIENHRESDVPLLLKASEQLLGAKQDAAAIRLWRHLASESMFPWPAADDLGNLLSNSRFSARPTSQGFDWRLVQSSGVEYALHSDSGGLNINFSGSEPEHFQLITQLVPIEGQRKYELSTKFQRNQADSKGLAWYILDARTTTFLKSGEIGSGVTLETPPNCRLIDLALRYNRPLGSTRIKGTLTLKSVVLRQL